jgi:hypothetical protein
MHTRFTYGLYFACITAWCGTKSKDAEVVRDLGQLLNLIDDACTHTRVTESEIVSDTVCACMCVSVRERMFVCLCV